LITEQYGKGTIKNFPNKIFAAQSVAKKQQMILCSKKFSFKKKLSWFIWNLMAFAFDSTVTASNFMS
jgi:hypothetical protein